MTEVYREGGPLGPVCPICAADQPHRVVVNEGRVGGFRCEGCNWVFDGTHGESQHPKNQRRREIWAEETRKPEPVLPLRSHKTEYVAPLTERLKGNEAP